MTLNKFEVGKTYETRSICDSDCVFSYKVVSRTAKTVTLDNGKRYRPHTYENREAIYPECKYSMCPTIKA